MAQHRLVSAVCVLAACGLAAPGWAQTSLSGSRAVTGPSGAQVTGKQRLGPATPTPAMTRDLLWTSVSPNNGIPGTVALAPTAAYAGQWLNGERLQRYGLPGSPTPVWEFLAGRFGPSVGATAHGADLTAFVDGT